MKQRDKSTYDEGLRSYLSEEDYNWFRTQEEKRANELESNGDNAS